MQRPDDTESLLTAALTGELSAAEQRALDARLQSDPALRAELEGLRAMQSLLAEDAAFGRADPAHAGQPGAGSDVPPAHLVDAILRAEAIVRPGSVRALQHAPPARSLTQRLMLWLVPGGVAVAAAAAFFVVTKHEPELHSAPMSAPAPDSVAQKPDAASAAAVAAGVNAEPPAKTEAALPADGEQEQLDNVGTGARGMLSRAARGAAATGVPGSDADRRAPSAKGNAFDDKAGLAVDGDNGSVGGSAGGFGGALGGATADTASGFAERARKAPELQGDGRAESAAEASAAPVKDSPRDSKPAAPPAPASVVSAAPVEEKRRASDEADAEDAPVAGKKLSVREALSKAKLEQAKETLADEPKTGGARPGSSRAAPQTPAAAAGPSRNDATAQQALMAFTTGMRELDARRFVEALDAFEDAALLDQGRSLGGSPVLGQIRALTGLNRPGLAASAARRVLTYNLASKDVVVCLKEGARLAEQTGDIGLARAFYGRLVQVKSERTAATAALRRLPADPPADKAAADAAPAEPAK